MVDLTLVNAVLFDFDFTLADSSAGVAECANFALRTLGLPEAEPADVRRTIGLTLPESMHRLSGIVDPTLAAEYARLFVRRADQVMANMTVVYPEVSTVLCRLRAQGMRVAIVSTKFRYRIEAILEREGLSKYVDAIVGGEDVATQKPDPSGILTVLSRWIVPPHLAIYSGDHTVDALAAKAAGVRFVGVLTGTTNRDDFATVDAHDLVGSVSDLPDFIFQNS